MMTKKELKDIENRLKQVESGEIWEAEAICNFQGEFVRKLLSEVKQLQDENEKLKRLINIPIRWQGEHCG